MTRHLLEQMLAHLRQAQAYAAGHTVEAFRRDARALDAVRWNLSQLGVCARRVPPEVREATPDLEWRKLTALPELLSQHFGLPDEILYDLVCNTLPTWAEAVQGSLTPLEK